MGGWRRGDRRSSITCSSPKYKRGNEKLDRHGNKKKSLYSPRKHDGGDDFASRHTKYRFQQSRHPHRIKREPMSKSLSKSRSRSMSRNPTDYHDSRRCKCRECESLHPCHIKEEHRDPGYRAADMYTRRKTANPKKRGSSSDSQHHKSLLPADKKWKYEERNLDLRFFEEKQSKKSSSSKEFSNHFLEKCNKYMTEGSLRKALKCINLALKVCKKEDKFSSKLYSRRGTIHSLLEKPRCSFQGILDWEHAFIIDKDNIEAKVNLSKIFFKAANKLFRSKAYHRSLTLCNHALGLHIRNGEASILFKLLKRKLLQKDLRKESTGSKITKENLSVAKYELHEAVLDEVKRLNDLIAEALKTNNFPLALKYCDLALRLFKSDIPDDNVYCDLLVLKQQLMNSIA